MQGMLPGGGMGRRECVGMKPWRCHVTIDRNGDENSEVEWSGVELSIVCHRYCYRADKSALPWSLIH